MEILVLDTETGGLDPNVNSLLQVGMIAYVDGKVVNTKEFTIKEDSYNINAYSLKYNGLNLYDDIYRDGVTRLEALGEILRFLQDNFNDKPILLGHNPSIDKYYIRKLFTDNKLDMDDYISHRMIDTMSIIWGLYFAGKLPIEACSSSGAFKHFGIEVKNLHRALDDCKATLKLFEKLVEMMKG